MTPEQVILLVEDNDDDAELALMAFSRARVTNPIVRTRDGLEGIDYLLGRGDHAGRDPSDVPAVVLLDLNLPRIDGITVLHTFEGTTSSNTFPWSSSPRRTRIDWPLTIIMPTASCASPSTTISSSRWRDNSVSTGWH